MSINNKVNILLSAKDGASKVIDKLSKNSGSLSKKLQANSATFKKMAGVGVVSFGALVAGVKKLTGAYEVQLAAEKQVAAGIKSTGGIAGKTLEDLKKQASALQGTSIFGDEDILQNVSAQFLSFSGIQGKVFDRAQQAALDLNTRLNGVNASGESLKGVSIQLGKALEDPIAGMAAMSKSGITFTEQQKEQIKTLVESGEVQKAQAVILDEVSAKYGGSAQAAADALGPTHQLSKSFGDMLEVVGGGLKPALDSIATAIAPVIEKFSTFASENPTLIKNLALMTGGVIALVTILGTLGLVVPVIITGFGTLATATTVLGTALKFLAMNPIGLLVTATVALGVVIYKMYKNWDDISWAIMDITGKMKDKVAGYWAIIEGLALSLGSKMYELGVKFGAFKDNAVAKLLGFKDAAIGVFTGVKDWAISTMGTMVEAVKGKFASMLNHIKGVLQRAKDTALEIATLGFAKTETFNGPSTAGTRASGGAVSAGQSYIVGERGQETFVPKTDGMIVPNSGGTGSSNSIGDIKIIVNGTGDPTQIAMAVERKFTETLQMYKMGIS